jgi:hydroxymethylbilane synthase
MRLRIAARQSDLARIQAMAVGRALLKQHPHLEIEFEFRSSFGDRRLDLAMDNTQEKGLFTQDFYEDLVAGQFDIVVHSWKDLPIEVRAGTEVVATLPRADLRDLLLVKSNSLGKSHWNILSSSPRRVYNLKEALPSLLPNSPVLDFLPVRGNIPTRISKLIDGEEDGLILAKAAVDRLLGAPEAEFFEMQRDLRSKLANCHWCVLPLSLNPAAAGQGALAIEIASNRVDLRELLTSIQCPETFAAARDEREILASYGGGCHQKIGISILDRAYGRIKFFRGLTDQGEVLDGQELFGTNWSSEWRTQECFMFPAHSGQKMEWTRQNLDVILPSSPKCLWVARSEAFPEQWRNHSFPLIWASGVKSWRNLAARGIWVHGCADSLGEQENPMLDNLLPDSASWLKLSHDEGARTEAVDFLATYHCTAVPGDLDLSNKTHFFWMSRSGFERARDQFPDAISNGFHACGPGNTFRFLQSVVPSTRLRVYLNYEHWRQSIKIGD